MQISYDMIHCLGEAGNLRATHETVRDHFYLEYNSHYRGKIFQIFTYKDSTCIVDGSLIGIFIVVKSEDSSGLLSY